EPAVPRGTCPVLRGLPRADADAVDRTPEGPRGIAACALVPLVGEVSGLDREEDPRRLGGANAVAGPHSAYDMGALADFCICRGAVGEASGSSYPDPELGVGKKGVAVEGRKDRSRNGVALVRKLPRKPLVGQGRSRRGLDREVDRESLVDPGVARPMSDG